jgi:hypothetical protein
MIIEKIMQLIGGILNQAFTLMNKRKLNHLNPI